jgi:hypothetical protein
MTVVLKDFMINDNENELRRPGTNPGRPIHSPTLYLLSLSDGIGISATEEYNFISTDLHFLFGQQRSYTISISQ